MSDDGFKPAGRIGPPRRPASGHPLLVWKNSFALGATEVDEEHKHFFEITNWLRCSILAGRPVAREALDRMTGHARCHFDYEEACLIAADCPYLPEHRSEHQQFVLALAHLNAQEAPSAEGVFCLARDWILDHILITDRLHKPWISRPLLLAPR
jgi:hemerythrin-like metal-binding protein